VAVGYSTSGSGASTVRAVHLLSDLHLDRFGISCSTNRPRKAAAACRRRFSYTSRVACLIDRSRRPERSSIHCSKISIAATSVRCREVSSDVSSTLWNWQHTRQLKPNGCVCGRNSRSASAVSTTSTTSISAMKSIVAPGSRFVVRNNYDTMFTSPRHHSFVFVCLILYFLFC
jgi:hypothetical protein